MGVPDEVFSPVRKRPRLSLRGYRKLESQDNSEAPETNVNKEADSQTSSGSAKKIGSTIESADLMADLPSSSSEPLVPPVASLHNLGNTCFLNSMLEVLRFTPGFQSGIRRLSQDIESVEKLQEESHCVNDGTQLVWQIVKNAHQLFEEMESRERQYNQLATSDASSMAVGPSALLEIIRKLNPMFEGHFQHDAQELLRCLLCYVEDAEKEVRRAADRIKPGRNESPAEKPSPFRCARGLTDVAGPPQPKGDAQGEVALKGGDSRRKEPGKELRRARRRQRSGALTSVNLIDSSIHTSVCELNNSSNPIAGQNPRLKMEALEGGDPIVNPSTQMLPNRLKRKRSRSGSLDKSDQPSLTPILNSPKAGNGNHKKMVKVDSIVSLRNGSVINFMRALDNSNNCEPKEQLGECRMAGSPLLQEKVTLSHNSKSSLHQDAVALQPSLKSISPFSETKFSGHTSICGQAQPVTSEQLYRKCCGKNIVEKRTSINWRGDDNNNNEDDLEISVKGDDLLNNSADSPILIDSEDDSCKPPLSAAKKLAPVTASPTKLFVYSPSKSPRVVEVVDEISILPDCSSAFFESTIDSVTKKYFSSLSPARLRTSSPPKPVVPEVGHISPETLTFPNIELIVEEPTADVSSEVGTAPNFTEEMHVTVHSPYKAENEDCGSASGSVTARPQTPLCSPTLGPPGLSSDQSLCASTDTATIGEESVHLLHPSSDTSYATSPGHERDPQQGQRTNKQSLSAPNSPVYAAVFSPLGKTTCRFPCEIRDRSLTGQSSKELQLRLKKCDWLGVSPVKSVSARKALSVLASGRHKGAVGETSAVRRKIFQNDDDGSSLGKSVSQDPQQQKKDVLLSSQQQMYPEPVDTEMGLSVDISYNSVDNASSSSRHSKSKRKKNNLNNSLSVSLRPRKRNSKPEKKDGDNNLNLNPQVEPLKKKDMCPKDLVSLSKAGLLKTLSVSLDRCDWLLSPGAGNKISARQAMLDVKKSAAARRSRGGGRFSSKTPISEPVKAANSDDVARAKTNTVVDHLFGGTMMHRTKCLECEMAKERQEVFMDISIPVRSLHAEDVDSDEEGGENSEDSCLDKLMQAFSNIERLKDNNKYFCEECIHYVEAERSCHYSTLPLVLTLHLKRFGSTSGRFGGVSKLNDKVAIPQHLPCLQYNCKNACTDPTHRYSLFAIVTHSGMSVFHGHYRAYVKVQPAVSPEVFANLCKMAIKSEPAARDAQSVTPDSEHPLSEGDGTGHSQKRANLNGNKLNKSEPKQEVKCEDTDGYLSNGFVAAGSTEQRDEVSNSGDMPPSPGRNNPPSQAAEWDCFWLECDDECIRVLEEGEFIEKLEEKDGALMGTPYILFYHKMVLA